MIACSASASFCGTYIENSAVIVVCDAKTYNPSMEKIYDLVIVGAGINGAALARLAAFNGIKTLVLDRGDFGGETSSNSSKLIHGGLRYLETANFGLVREALQEREKLSRLAPHLVRPIDLMLPLTPYNRHGKWMTKIGLSIYDVLAGRLGRGHHYIGKKNPDAHLFASGLMNGAYTYPDCMVDDARLTLELILDAKSMGADVANYTEFMGVEESRDNSTKGLLEMTLCSRDTDIETEVYTKKLAFCLGPWHDLWAKREFSKTNSVLSRSQGIHLYMDGLPIQSAYLLPVPKSSRYFFVLPYMNGHLIGTTETEISENEPGPFVPQEKEVEELKQLFQLYFPSLSRPYTCVTVGVRPLARAKHGNLTKASRSPAFHKLHDHVWAGVGGKYTTHAPFAETLLGKIYQKERPLKVLGGRSLPGSWKKSREDVDASLVALGYNDAALRKIWLDRYGERAFELGQYVLNHPEGKKFLSSKYSLLKGEVYFAIEKEYAKCPVDFMRRRTSIFFTEQGGFDLYQEIKEIFERALPSSRTLEKIDGYLEFLQRHKHHGVN